LFFFCRALQFGIKWLEKKNKTFQTAKWLEKKNKTFQRAKSLKSLNLTNGYPNDKNKNKNNKKKKNNKVKSKPLELYELAGKKFRRTIFASLLITSTIVAYSSQNTQILFNFTTLLPA
jgi:hypothetical protein